MKPSDQNNPTSSTRSSTHRASRARHSAPYGNEALPPDAPEKSSDKHRRADQVRQAAHDAHGFQTHGHVALPPGAPRPTKAHIPKTHAPKSHGSRRHKMPDLDALDEAARQRRERLARRKRVRVAAAKASQKVVRPSKRGRWALALSTVLVMGVGVLAFTRPEMNVQKVKIEGAHLTDPQMLSRVQSSLVGKNVLRTGLSKTEKFLASQPPVESVSVKRLASWPPQIAVSVVERTPFARVGDDQNWWVVDKNGVPFRRAQKLDENLHAIYFENIAPVAGEKLPAPTWNRALQFVRVLEDEKRAGREWKLRRIYFDGHGFASLRMTGGAHNETLVQLGNDDWRRKLARARAAFAYFDQTGRRASRLNLITYAVPVYTPIASQIVKENRVATG